MRNILSGLMIMTATAAVAAGDLPAGLTFGNIDGGTIALDDLRGHPVLVVNTASMCGFSGQFTALQALYDQYRDAGLVVLAVPSDDFNQELASDDAVKAYCEMTFGIDMPMTTITPVSGPDAHPFYRWLEVEHGIAPRWNFNKVLIGADGAVLGNWGVLPGPESADIIGAVERALAD